MTLDITPLAPVPVATVLGEGIVWDEIANAFLWTDINRSTLYQLHWPDRVLQQFSLPYRLGSMALTNKPGTIIAAFERGFAYFDLASSALQWLARPDLPPGVRFNDGRVDRSGRFVAGTMVEDDAQAGNARAGKLFRLERDASLRVLMEGIAISNALCWSPDGQIMYHGDSMRGTVSSYAYSDNEIGAATLFMTTDSGIAPDGATIDAAGRMWVALWGGSCVDCIDASGERIARVALPVSQPTCVAFGGADLNILAVTTASDGVEEAQAGNLFLFETNVRGLKERRVIL
jgi:L-arabinonolactonase